MIPGPEWDEFCSEFWRTEGLLKFWLMSLFFFVFLRVVYEEVHSLSPFTPFHVALKQASMPRKALSQNIERAAFVTVFTVFISSLDEDLVLKCAALNWERNLWHNLLLHRDGPIIGLADYRVRCSAFLDYWRQWLMVGLTADKTCHRHDCFDWSTCSYIDYLLCAVQTRAH